MLVRNALLVSAAASLGVAAPAAACDQHGPGQMGGFHRYNPFANAFNNIGSRAAAKEEPVIVRKDKSAERKKEDKRRQQALEAEADSAKADAEQARSVDLRAKSRPNDWQGRSALK